MMMNLALEMKEHGVHCTTYCPGGVASGMAQRNASYRPARYGGPQQGEIPIPKASFSSNPVHLFPPDAIAPIVLRAVRSNRPFIFDHAEHREAFRATYADVVEACYDDIAEWEREHGRPDVVFVRGG
jgi:short-subunit dehydrogenase